MAVEDDRPIPGHLPNGTEPLREVVMELAPSLDMAAPAPGPTVPTMVVGPRVQAGRSELLADVLIAAGVFAQAVDQQQMAPWPAGPRTAGRRLVGQPVPNQELGPVGGPGVADDGGHDGSVRARRARYHALVPRWTEIGDRVFVRRYAFYDQNIGVVLGDGAALVVDTRSTHAQGREILADLRELTPFPVTVVVDTHGHFDHAFGNRVFRPPRCGDMPAARRSWHAPASRRARGWRPSTPTSPPSCRRS